MSSSNLLRLKDLLQKRAVSKAQHYLDIQKGLFTKPIKLCGEKAVAWPEDDVTILNAARISGIGDDEIRSLVHKIESERKAFLGNVLRSLRASIQISDGEVR